MQLGQALLLAGDILNASIALGITTKPLAEVRRRKDIGTIEETNNEFSDGKLVPPAAEVQDEQSNEHAHTPENISSHAGSDRPSPTAEKTPIAVSGDEQHQRQIKQEVDAQEETHLVAEQEDVEKMWEADTEEEAATQAEEEQEEQPQGPVDPKYDGFDCKRTCDGQCQTPNTSYAKLYFCRVCHDLCFCKSCVELVRTDKLPFKKCASDHSFVDVFPMIEEAEPIIEMRFEVQQEWLESLRKAWDAESTVTLICSQFFCNLFR